MKTVSSSRLALRSHAARTLSQAVLLAIIPSAAQCAIFTVVNTNTTGPGSLQQAILDANTNAGADSITFAITNLSFTISPTNALPTLTEPVTIDGTTQPGFAGTPMVELNGASAGAAVDGLKIITSNCLVRALVINRFLGDGIEIATNGFNTVDRCYIGLNVAGTVDTGNTANGILITNSANNIIGGLGLTNRNYISGNNANGLHIGGAAATNNSVVGNVIGLSVANSDLGNSTDGIRLNAPANIIGGNVTGARNIISGNSSDGIEITASATNNTILGNYIGTDTNGVLDLGNSGNGILVGGGGIAIGGATPGSGNVISGNDNGIELNGLPATNALIRGNFIGTDWTGTNALGNGINGVLITSSSRSNNIGGITLGAANIIAFNTQDGINVAAANANTNNTFRGNSIYSNGDLGIDLGAASVIGNDVGDGDVGANQLQNFPVLTGVTNTSAGTVIAGTLNSRANTTFALDFYANVLPNASGNGEGQTYLGSTNLTTDGTGITNFLLSLPVTTLQGRYVTATATDEYGNTSEFATNFFALSTVAGITFTVVNTNDSGPGSLREAINQANAAINAGDTIAFNITNLTKTISPATALPTIIDPVTIDGYTQPGSATNTSPTTFNGTLIVRLDGDNVPANTDGLKLAIGNNTVRGLVITRFAGGSGDGIELNGFGGNTIAGNIIGLDIAGTDLGNGGNGVLINASSNNVVGGMSPGARNVISGNTSDGVEIIGAGAVGNLVVGNLVGSDLTGSLDRGNGNDGVLINNTGGNIIGGLTAGAGNLLSGNDNGVEISGLSATNNSVLGNRMGTDVSGTATLANSINGILITSNARSNLVGNVLAGAGNTVAYNGADGIAVASGTNNTFRGNSIFSNGNTTAELGIDLGTSGVTPNDSGDPDTGANQLQNFPTLTGVTNTPAGTTISGSLNSQPSTTYTLDFYSSVSFSVSGNGGGQTYLGSTNLTTATDSNLTFTVFLPVTNLAGRYITATATDPFGNTSEFSVNVSAVSTIAGLTLTVVNTNDTGAGSLRQAIINANAAINAGDTITFAITNLGTTIAPASALPSVIDPVIIDGYTQAGAVTNGSPNAFNGVLPVRLAGNSAGLGANGLLIAGGRSTVRGLMITGFGGNGIELSGFGNNVIEGCVVGLDAAGADQGNIADGVLITGSSSNLIGGAALAGRNVLSGNNGDGIEISGALGGNNQIINNLIGSDQTGTVDRGNNDRGVYIASSGGNTIGGSSAGSGNFISGNNDNGIELSGISATNNLVQGNRIGTTLTAGSGMGNTGNGVFITSSSRSNIVGGVLAGQANVIAFNGGDGISIAAATANTNNILRGNSIFSNTGLGINLGATGVTLNDTNDVDTGANQLQNFPVLSVATNSPTQLGIVGSLASVASTSYIVDFYAGTNLDLSGFGEGQNYLGSANLTTDGSGHADFVVSFPTVLPGHYISATATDPYGNTSEFSRWVVSVTPPTNFIAVQTADFVFIVDATGSMSENIAAVKNGLASFVAGLNTASIDARFAIVLFGGAPELVLDFTADRLVTESAFDLIRIGVLTGFQNNHDLNPEAGLETIRIVLNAATNSTLLRNNVGGSGPLAFRPEARKNLILVTDENSDLPFYAENRQAGQTTADPPSPLTAAWQAEIDATAQVVISNNAFVNLLIAPSITPSESQYGAPAQSASDANFLNFNPGMTLANLIAAGYGNSLEARVLAAGLVGRAFDIGSVNTTNFIANFFSAKLEEIINNPTTRPRLFISALPSAVRLTWTTNSAGFLLETNHVLTLTNGWGVLTTNYSVIGTNYAVTNNVSDPLRFYRLRK